jgi:hypothetical protein
MASEHPVEVQVEPSLPKELAEATPAGQRVSTTVAISPSESLAFEDVSAFLCSQPATIVVLLGDRDSGKSTLICSLYDRFLHGPFAACDSCGIRTVIGLERRAHLERISSGRATPETQHTSIAEGLQYFHFPVSMTESANRRQDILISDRAGELYRNARGNSQLVEQLVEIRSADFVVILLDGARLVEPSSRAGAFYAVRQSLQMLLDRGAMDTSYRVQVVTTKSDLINKAPDVDLLKERLSEFEARTLADFSHRLASLIFYTISARDPDGTFTPAFGVDTLLNTWLDGPKVRVGISTTAVEPATEFDKLSTRPESIEEAIQ